MRAGFNKAAYHASDLRISIFASSDKRNYLVAAKFLASAHDDPLISTRMREMDRFQIVDSYRNDALGSEAALQMHDHCIHHVGGAYSALAPKSPTLCKTLE